MPIRLVMAGWPKQMLTVARNMSKADPAVWIAFINIVVCFSVCPDLVRLMAGCQDLSCHWSKAFSAAQSCHGF